MGTGNPSLIYYLNGVEVEYLNDGLINGEKLKIGDVVNSYTTDGNHYGSFGIISAPVFEKSIPALDRIEKNGITIFVPSRAKPLIGISIAETRAIDTLREMITEAEYRRYIKCGFILVKGRSGCIYQVFRNKSHTKVWKRGRVIKEVCVRIKDKKIPLTDNVIAFKVLIEGSEDEFEKLGNVYKMTEAA